MSKQSSYRMGWILAIFDLPVATPDQRRDAARFRNWLLDDGYLMVQYSVYVRPCVTYEHLEKHSARAKSSAPRTGFVKILFFTDKQWELSINIVGHHADLGSREPAPEMPEQILFW
jgi:CRISPR-associated protein Cas2